MIGWVPTSDMQMVVAGKHMCSWVNRSLPWRQQSVHLVQLVVTCCK